MKHAKTREVIRNIAKDHKVSNIDAENVITSVFEFLRHVMSDETDREEGFYPTVRIPNFATFYVPTTLQERYKELNKKKLDESIRVQELEAGDEA